MIKFYDLYNQDKKLHSKIIAQFKKIINKTNYILGDEVEIFEKNFANFVGAKYGFIFPHDALLASP